MRCGLTVSAAAQTGQSDAIHSPDECASMVVRLTMPVAGSMAVVCTVAISCWPSVLRTMSRPLANGAYRKNRSASPGRPARIVATSEFSGLVSAACALASAGASAATVSLDRGMGGLRVHEIEAHRAGFRALGPHAVANSLLSVFRQKSLEFAPGTLMFEKGFSRVAVDGRKLSPGI